MTRLLAPAATHTVHRVTPADAARMRALRLEMLADSPLAFLETLAQAAARSHTDYRRRISQASAGPHLAQFIADPSRQSGRQTSHPADQQTSHTAGELTSPLAGQQTGELTSPLAGRQTGELTSPLAGRQTGELTSQTAGQRVNQPGARLIGHAGGTVLPEEPNCTVVFAVYITPAARGRGVLNELVEAVAEWSLASGRKELMLEVVVGNDRAVRAYERLGFEDTGVRVPHPVTPVMTELQMRRRA